MRSGLAIAAVVLVALSSALTGAPAFAAPPRALPLHFRATGFFRVQHAAGRWWIVTPDGRPFYSSGINHVTADTDTDRTTGTCPYCDAVAAKYPSTDAWADATTQRLRAWGFNTIASWSDIDRFASRMPYTVLLNVASGDDWFAPGFVARGQAVAQGEVAARRDDPNLVGWILDSELRWTPDWRSSNTLLADYLALPAGSPGRAVAERYAQTPTRFLRALADRYFSVTTRAIRAVDPHHLILGVKMVAQLTPIEVLQAARRYVDVFSIDDYTLVPGLDDYLQKTWGPFVPVDPTLAAQYAVLRRPIIIGEYSFRAADAGVPNSWPPIFPTYATQADRAAAYRSFVEPLYGAPWIVGDDWFEYVDEPAGGRFDGEDSNFGVVSTGDVPWQTLVDTMTQVHAEAPDRVADPAPACLAWRRTGPTNAGQCANAGRDVGGEGKESNLPSPARRDNAVLKTGGATGPHPSPCLGGRGAER